MISRVTSDIKKTAWPDKHIMDEIFLININRVFYLSVISVVVRFFTIISLLNKAPSGYQNENTWQIGILASHITYLVLLIILSILSYKYRKNNKPTLGTIFTQYVAIVLIIFYGVTITLIDQLVTPSITPFLIACISIGVIFLIKPLHGLMMFFTAYIIYFYAMGIVQPNLSILLSNRINGFTSIILGLFISLVLWKSNVVNLQQKEQILLQQKELEEKNEKLEYLATRDSLTGLVNRRYFEEQAAHEIVRIKRYGGNSCLLLLDIDNFKEINDKYGHPTGDKVLQNLASVLRTQLRKADLIARIGGEEFAIILINTDDEAGNIVAEKLRCIIENDSFIVDNKVFNITVSIGITLIDNNVDSYEEVYKRADKALYTAKAEGKNRACIEFAD